MCREKYSQSFTFTHLDFVLNQKQREAQSIQ